MCFGQVDWIVLVVCVWSCVLVIKSIHRGCDCEGKKASLKFECDEAARHGVCDARHIPTYRVIATIRIHVMTWGSSLVRGKASFGLN